MFVAAVLVQSGSVPVEPRAKRTLILPREVLVSVPQGRITTIYAQGKWWLAPEQVAIESPAMRHRRIKETKHLLILLAPQAPRIYQDKRRLIT